MGDIDVLERRIEELAELNDRLEARNAGLMKDYDRVVNLLGQTLLQYMAALKDLDQFAEFETGERLYLFPAARIR